MTTEQDTPIFCIDCQKNIFTGTTFNLTAYDTPTQLVNLFSPSPNYAHSDRATPSSVGGAFSGRSSVDSVNISRAISFNMQQDVRNIIHPITHQGLLSVLDPDVLVSKKVSDREKGSTSYTSVGHVILLSIISEIPDTLMGCL